MAKGKNQKYESEWRTNKQDKDVVYFEFRKYGIDENLISRTRKW